MSTPPVVGNCTDCIVDLPQTDPISMKLEVYVSNGFKGVIRRIGTFTGYYPTPAVAQHSAALAPGDIYNSTTAVTALFVATTQPVTVSVTKATVTQTFTVNRLLILDDSYDSFSITNPGTATETANVTLDYTTQTVA